MSRAAAFPASASAGQPTSDLPVRKHRFLVATLVVLTLAYYFWTTLCSSPEISPIRPRGVQETDHYNLLSHGFLKGHLHLDGEVPRELLEVANPYDPASREGIQVLHDASFYRGKYYIYFGPAPVVSLFLPFTVITGRDLPIPYAVWVFCSGAFLVLVAIFLSLQRRYFPLASAWSIAAGIIAIGGGSMIVSLVRRPNIWELAGSSGLFYFAVAMLCLVRALHARRSLLWATVGGVALGMAVASRPTYIVCSAVFAVPLLFFYRHAANPETNYNLKSLVGAAAGCTVIVLGLFAYNYARFENPFEFGQKYQLSSIIEGDARHFSLSYVWFNFRVYFLVPLRWIGVFPFHDSIALPPRPDGHGGYEYVIGMLPNLPFSWFGLPALAYIFSFFRRVETHSLRVTLSVLCGAALLPAALLLTFFGSCIRYMADFTPWFMVLAAFGLLLCEHRPTSNLARVALRGTGIALALFSAAVAGLAIVNLYNFTPAELPPRYQPIARVLNYPAFALNLRRWPDHQPRKITFSFPNDRAPRHEVLVGLTRGASRTADLGLEYLSDQQARFFYRENISGRVIYSQSITPPPNADTPHTLKLSFGDPAADYDGDRFRLRAEFDGRSLWDFRTVSLRAFPADIMVHPADRERFIGTIHGVQPISNADLRPPAFGGVRLRVTLNPGMAGRSFPLVVTGRPERGDFVYLRVGNDGQVSFGYDHWGSPGVQSPEIAMGFDRPHVLECWAPVVTARADASTDEARLLIKLNGAIVWDRTMPFFAAGPDHFHVAHNPIGGSSCESLLDPVVVEETRLPSP